MIETARGKMRIALIAGVVGFWLTSSGCDWAALPTCPWDDATEAGDPEASQPESGEEQPSENPVDVEDYDARLADLRDGGDACAGLLWAVAGICGDLLYITETNGYSGRTSYFDAASRAWVAGEEFTDFADDVRSETNPVDCAKQTPTEVFCDQS